MLIQGLRSERLSEQSGLDGNERGVKWTVWMSIHQCSAQALSKEWAGGNKYLYSSDYGLHLTV